MRVLTPANCSARFLHACRYLTVDVSDLAAQVSGWAPTDISGFEDPRAFELDGRLHLLAFFYRINDTLRCASRAAGLAAGLQIN